LIEKKGVAIFVTLVNRADADAAWLDALTNCLSNFEYFPSYVRAFCNSLLSRIYTNAANC
jgi:hypothetical protein